MCLTGEADDVNKTADVPRHMRAVYAALSDPFFPFLLMLNSQGSGLDVPDPPLQTMRTSRARPIPEGTATYQVWPTTHGDCLGAAIPKSPSPGPPRNPNAIH